jgi:tetratricopeptide (TPR) repeat protein
MELGTRRTGFLKVFEIQPNNSQCHAYYSYLLNILGRPEEALELIEEAFKGHDQDMPYISTHAAEYDQLYDYSRFIAILEKMNLSLPEK